MISRVDLSPSPAKSCVEVTLADGTEIILDAGTGIRELGEARDAGEDRASFAGPAAPRSHPGPALLPTAV